MIALAQRTVMPVTRAAPSAGPVGADRCAAPRHCSQPMARQRDLFGAGPGGAGACAVK
jgi:hypothetical protein